MTKANPAQAQASLHEATLAGISQRGDTIDLKLDDVAVGDARVPASVTINGVQRILREGSPVETVSMEAQDGEVLSLRQEGDRVLFVVQWNDFAAKRETIVTYALLGGRLVLRVAAP